jgi:hypothetical protein
MTNKIAALAGAIALLTGGAAQASQFAYPAKGQSPALQAKDEAQCSSWAVGKTGFDPAKPPPPSATPAPVTGSGARVKGAAVGATVGAISGGNAGQAAAAGAVVGGVARRAANRRAAAAQNQAASQQMQAGQAAYAQARGACLMGRGYTVK